MNGVEQKRKFYRLKYPSRSMPSVLFSMNRYRVSEVSEGGIRVIMGDSTSLYKGSSMKGVLSLHNDCDVQIAGSILRFDDHEVIVKLEKGPTFKNMVDEQRHIRSNYPVFFERLRSSAAQLS